MTATAPKEDDCEACHGTGNNNWMRSPYPIRKNLNVDCPACKGTRKTPKAS